MRSIGAFSIIALLCLAGCRSTKTAAEQAAAASSQQQSAHSAWAWVEHTAAEAVAEASADSASAWWRADSVALADGTRLYGIGGGIAASRPRSATSGRVESTAMAASAASDTMSAWAKTERQAEAASEKTAVANPSRWNIWLGIAALAAGAWLIWKGWRGMRG